ncbi:hypothetical protein JI664_22250 [Rhodobacter sp. NTK016B]|uniref:hypothetical protein n=1 Tax=Rhodobacter sp. NTK016B TaxID=2759676 RepID=UPI001A8CC505|nr:hypothetical protein [Rhodobacter sp. NTK016B]MBN8294709.1 hypothetical protein [Rhodobacter sp. NTK016B]
MSDPVATARASWGAEAPDWVLRLAEECALSSQSKVATKLGRSAALVSNVLRKKYPGDMGAVEDLVRGTYMRATTLCPALGEISVAECRRWIQSARAYTNENSERVRMYRACRRCPRGMGNKA